MSLTKALPYRLAVYFTERFPVLVYIPFSIILYLCLSFLVQLISGVDPVFDQYGVAGCLTAFLFMLLIRTFDDIKDVDLDHDIFPDRPVSRGAVLIKDVYGLAINEHFNEPRRDVLLTVSCSKSRNNNEWNIRFGIIVDINKYFGEF